MLCAQFSFFRFTCILLIRADSLHNLFYLLDILDIHMYLQHSVFGQMVKKSIFSDEKVKRGTNLFCT